MRAARPDTGPWPREEQVSVPVDRLRALSRVSSWRGTLDVAGEWLGVALAIGLCEWSGNLWLLPVAVLWIGARMHAMGVLMHEATHYRLFRNRRLNDFVGDWLLARPLGISLAGYRSNHLAHHRRVNGEGDPDRQRKRGPDWHFPKSAWGLVWLFFRDLCGWNIPEHVRGVKDLSQDQAGRWRRLLPPLIVVGGLVALGWGVQFLIYWLLPMLTWFQAILRLRSIAEHFGVPNSHALNASRTTRIGGLTRLWVAPKHVEYHLEHHLYPSVPHYRLPALARLLEADEEYRARAHRSDGYLAVLREVMRTPDAPAKEQEAAREGHPMAA